MDYAPPYDAVQAQAAGWQNAGYVNGQPGNGIEGSIPNAGALEAPQREILSVQDEVGLTRSAASFNQMLKAIRSGLLSTFVDKGTAANAIVVAPTTPHTNLMKGLALRLFPAFTNTLANVGLSLSGIGGVLLRRDGSALAPGDVVAGLPLDAVCDGAAWRHMGMLPSDVRDTIASGTLGHRWYTFQGRQTTQWVCPAGVYWVFARVWGSGGGGGGAAATGAAGGGGAGGYSEGWVQVTPGQTYVVIVGAGGAAGVAGPNSGFGGQTSSFGGLVAANGGGAGVGAGSGGAQAFGSGATPGAGGAYNIGGGSGGSGLYFSSSVQLGGSGGGAQFGGAVAPATAGAGTAGNTPGGGGTGAANNNAGGNGADGCILLLY